MLGELERKFADKPVTIVGVHTNKFPAENEARHVRQTMEQFDVSHPVVLDDERGIWQSYAVRAWPTLVFIRPDGTIAATLPGEPDTDNLEEIVSHLIDEGIRLGTLGRARSEIVEAASDASATNARPLSFPSAVVATPTGLAIASSGNHSLVLVDGRGRIQCRIGEGVAGLADGPPERARFHRPRGLAHASGRLFVADAGNHALRAVDLESLEVTTLAGDGTLGRLQPDGLAPAKQVALRSPWDVVYGDGIVFVAMAGFHQIWAYLPSEDTIGVFAGSGREALVDGALHEAAFAQPMALTAHDDRLYVADSEASAVREVDLGDRRVRTLAGEGLFVYGDVDGGRERARLQHPRGISHGPNGLLVSDTLNGKIKRLDRASGTIETWFDGKEDVETEAETALGEPTGLTQLEGGQVIVADNRHHRVLVIDGLSRKAKALTLGESP